MLDLRVAFGTLGDCVATVTDSQALRVERAALEYIDAWYEGDAERMREAVHPDLAKRTVRSLPDGGHQVIEHMSADLLAAVTRTGRGGSTPPSERLREVRVLD
ncbi:MAG TPA: nuclear transport factor 2 family protein, partial [Deinococcales bacterium]|nr:nuclear transport factor 2 family protein [Deinococcales bacterium]